jgi:hypothetical protein
VKSERSGELDYRLFRQDAKLGLLEQQLYGHVLAAIDLDRLFQLETSLFGILTDDTGISDELALDVASQLVERALVRAADPDARFIDWGPPEGITEAERRAVAFDEACPICVEDRAVERQRALSGDRVQPPDEPCPCCDDLANSWREQHAAVLAKAGLDHKVARTS